MLIEFVWCHFFCRGLPNVNWHIPSCSSSSLTFLLRCSTASVSNILSCIFNPQISSSGPSTPGRSRLSSGIGGLSISASGSMAFRTASSKVPDRKASSSRPLSCNLTCSKLSSGISLSIKSTEGAGSTSMTLGPMPWIRRELSQVSPLRWTNIQIRLWSD